MDRKLFERVAHLVGEDQLVELYKELVRRGYTIPENKGLTVTINNNNNADDEARVRTPRSGLLTAVTLNFGF